MTHETEAKLPAKPHVLTLEGRNLLSVTGVDDVESFDENQIVMNTSQGDLIVRGSGLHISKISLDVGEMKVGGLITEMCYEEPAPTGSVWSRLFK